MANKNMTDIYVMLVYPYDKIETDFAQPRPVSDVPDTIEKNPAYARHWISGLMRIEAPRPKNKQNNSFGEKKRMHFFNCFIAGQY